MTDLEPERRGRRRLLGWALCAAIVVLAVLAAQHWRAAHAPQRASMTVPGGDGGGWPRATPDSEGFDSVALQRAADYARNSGAQAFLVTRHAHLVVEQYGGGVDADSNIDGGPFAGLLVALTAGIAVHDLALPEPQGAPPAAALATQIAAISHMSYPQFLSRNLWQPLNAAAAQIRLAAPGERAAADCCFLARAGDWLRIAELVLADGRFEGTQVVPAGWSLRLRQASAEDPGRALGLWLAGSARGAEPYLAREVLFVRGLGQTRLWMAPQQHIAILLVEQRAAADTGDETRLPNMVFRALREAPSGARQNIGELVPNH